MQKIGAFLLVLCLMSGLSPLVDGADASAPAPQVILVVSVGEVDAALVDRVSRFVALNLPFETQPGHTVAWTTETLEGAVDLVSDQLSEAFVGMLVFAAPTQTIAETGMTSMERKAAVVNVSAVQDEDAEKVGRRAERMAIRGLSEFLHLPSCPNPRCALCELDERRTLDDIGRGLCPPCMVKAQHQTVEQP